MRIQNKMLIKLIIVTYLVVHIKYTWCTLHVNDNCITVSYPINMFVAEDWIWELEFRLYIRTRQYSSRFRYSSCMSNSSRSRWKLAEQIVIRVCPQIISLVLDDLFEVECSLLSVPAQNNGLVLVIPGAPVARVAEWGVCCRAPRVLPESDMIINNLITAKLLHKY